MTHASIVMSIALFLLFTPAAIGQTSTRHDFQEYCKLVQGRWVNATAKLVTPSNEAGAQPEAEYCVNRIAADGHALDSTSYLGELTGRWLTVWDAGTQQIREFFVQSDGATAHSVLAKKDGTWVRTATLTTADGTQTQLTSTLVEVSPDGKTHTWTGLRSEGKTIYRRVSQENNP